MTLKKFLEKKFLPGNMLSVTIVKKLQPYQYVVGDSSCLALLKLPEDPSQEKSISVGLTVKLIKPVVISEDIIESNKNFKPMKSKETIKIEYSEDDLSKFKIQTVDKKTESNSTSFQEIKENASQVYFPSITVLVSNVSRLIDTKQGKYQIAGIVDKESQKTSINLYDSSIGKLHFDKIYTITKVKKSILKTNEMRLSTTKFTKISEASEEEQAEFENVKIAENIMTGIILGHSDINVYNSCPQHWSKLDEDNQCSKCEKTATIRLDFNSELYIQDNESEEVKAFLIFKRQLPIIAEEDDQDEIERKLDALEGTNCRIEFEEPESQTGDIIPKRIKLENNA